MNIYGAARLTRSVGSGSSSSHSLVCLLPLDGLEPPSMEAAGRGCSWLPVGSETSVLCVSARLCHCVHVKGQGGLEVWSHVAGVMRLQSLSTTRPNESLWLKGLQVTAWMVVNPHDALASSRPPHVGIYTPAEHLLPHLHMKDTQSPLSSSRPLWCGHGRMEIHVQIKLYFSFQRPQ